MFTHWLLGKKVKSIQDKTGGGDVMIKEPSEEIVD